MRKRLAPRLALLAIALLVGLAPATAKIPSEAVFAMDAEKYLYATGVVGSGHMVVGDGDGIDGALPYHACAFVMLHPGTPNGRVMVRGLYANSSSVDVFVEQFKLPDGKRGYSYDTVADVDGHDAFSDLALRGNASLRVDGDRYLDPSTDNDTMSGSMALLADGVRDDLSGGRLAAPLEDVDHELHIEVTSLPDNPPTQAQLTFDSGGLVPPTEAYGNAHVFDNTKFGGRAVIELSMTAAAPEGMNELAFQLLAPSGRLVGEATVAAAALAGGSGTIEAPLDEFGRYLLLVGGKLAFGSYSAQVTLEPPEDFRLHLWWENVTFGAQAYDDYTACTKAVGSPDEVVAVESITGRPDPPQLNLKWVFVGVAAGVAVVTVGVKLLSDQISLSAFRKSK